VVKRLLSREVATRGADDGGEFRLVVDRVGDPGVIRGGSLVTDQHLGGIKNISGRSGTSMSLSSAWAS
jgi:hypothetical protein